MVLPLPHLPARFLHHPFADGNDRSGPLGDGNEHRRLDDAARGMVPEHARFEADDASRGDLHLRLIVQLQLAARDGNPQLARQQHARVHLPVEVGVVEAVAVTPVVLGAIEREIRLHHEIGRGARRPGRQRDADAGGDGDIIVADGAAFGDRRADLLGQRAGIRWAGDVPLQNGELVAAETGDEIVLAHGLPQPLADLDDQRVTGRMAECVVDILEAVEVEEQHRELRLVAGARAKRVIEVIEERAAVGEARQRILARQRGDARVGGVELVGKAHVDGQDQHRRAKKQKRRCGDGDRQPLLVDLQARRRTDRAGSELRGCHSDVMHGADADAHGEGAEQPLPHHVGHGLAAQQEGERQGQRRRGDRNGDRGDDQPGVVSKGRGDLHRRHARVVHRGDAETHGDGADAERPWPEDADC